MLADVLVQLTELGPPSELRRRSPEVVAGLLGFDAVLLSAVERSQLVPEAGHAPGGGLEGGMERLRAARLTLEYPLVEAEAVRRRRPRLVHATPVEPGRHAVLEALGWSSCVVAPVVLDGTVLGVLHATSDHLVEDDAAALGAFATCLAIVYERAVLRRRLRAARQQLRDVARWAESRTGELGERLVTLAGDGDEEEAPGPRPSAPAGSSALREQLTHRELDVLRLVAAGATNSQIAAQLVLSAGTVKFHVKNILRKTGAANRAEATSQYLRQGLDARP